MKKLQKEWNYSGDTQGIADPFWHRQNNYFKSATIEWNLFQIVNIPRKWG
jgi:hypothetical protein